MTGSGRKAEFVQTLPESVTNRAGIDERRASGSSGLIKPFPSSTPFTCGSTDVRRDESFAVKAIQRGVNGSE